MKKNTQTPKSFRGKLFLNILFSTATGAILVFLVLLFFQVAAAVFAVKSSQFFGGIIALALMAYTIGFYAYYWFWLSYEAIRDNARKDKIVRGILPKSFLNYGRYKVAKTGPGSKSWEWRTFREGCGFSQCKQCSNIIYEWDWVETETEARAAAEQSLSEYRWRLAYDWVKYDLPLPGTTLYVHSIEAPRIPHPKSADKEYFEKLEESKQKFLEACQKRLGIDPQ